MRFHFLIRMPDTHLSNGINIYASNLLSAVHKYNQMVNDGEVSEEAVILAVFTPEINPQ